MFIFFCEKQIIVYTTDCNKWSALALLLGVYRLTSFGYKMVIVPQKFANDQETYR